MDRQRDEAHIVVLADTDEAAIAYGKKIRASSWWKVIPISAAAQEYDLYGHIGLPFDVVPSTAYQPWHMQRLQHHIAYKRIVPRRKIVMKDGAYQ